MDERRAKAILNNNDLYEAVFGAQRINSQRNDAIWYCFEKTPPLYSNLVTVAEDWRPDKIFRRIDTNFKAENRDEWSIKDSFAVLDLAKYGFKKLFDAQWIYLEAEKFKKVEKTGKLSYKIIEDEGELSKWKLAWDADEKLGNEIFRPQLLENTNVFFIAGYERGKIVVGCFANKTADVLGISNFFAPDEKIGYWSETINFIFDQIERVDLVGYEQSNLVRELQNLGFEAIGDLTVWLKESDL